MANYIRSPQSPGIGGLPDFTPSESLFLSNITGHSYTDGQLMIGNSSTGGISFATITQGTGITVTNGHGTITIASTSSGGDFSSNTATSVLNEIVLFADTTGKLGKRSTGSGIALLASGVLSTITAPTGTIVGTSDSQTLTNKDLTSGTNTFPTFNQNTSGSAATLTTGRTISITGDLTYTSPSFDGSGNVTAAGTLATVNTNVGSFGSTTAAPSFTVNGKGLLTAAGSNTITPAVGSITGLATGIATFLATPSSANLISAVTDETGTGALVFGTSPTLTTAVLGSSTATTQSPADNSTKVATTAYVDAAVLGQNFKEAALVATTANLVGVYLSGVFTYTATGTDNIDGVNLVLGNRVLVKNQTTTFQNGIYSVTTAGSIGVAGVLTRTTDANSSAEFKTGDSIFVTSGTVNTSTTWAYTGVDSPTIGTTAITYAQTAGQGTVTAGNGIAVTGLSVAIDTSVTVDKTTSQTLTNKTLTSPTLTTPSLGAATATTINGNTLTTGTYTLTGTAAKTLNFTNTITLSGTDSTTMTFPTTSATIARTDAAQTFTGTQTFATIAAATNSSINVSSGSYNTIQTYTPSAAGTATLDLSKGNVHHITMPAGNITIAISNSTAGQCIILRILQDGTGSRTVTWFTTIKWAGGSTPTLTTAASKADTFGFEVTTAGSAYDGFIVGQNI